MQDNLIAFMLYSSVFSQTRYGYEWGIDAILNNICMWITTMLSYLLDVVQALVEGAWNFLQYSSFGFATNGETITNQLKGKIGSGTTFNMANNANSTDAASLYKFFTDYLWIPLGIALLFFIIKFVFLDKKSDNIKRFTNNIGALVVIVLILPYVFVNVNTLIFRTSNNSPILSVDSESLSAKILYQNTTDYLYLNDTIMNQKKGKMGKYMLAACKRNRFGNYTLSYGGVNLSKNAYMNSIKGKSKKESKYLFELTNIENFPINQRIQGSIFDKKLSEFGRNYLESVEGNAKKKFASSNKNLSEKSFNDKKEDLYWNILLEIYNKTCSKDAEENYSPEKAKAEIKKFMGFAGEFVNTELVEKTGEFGINMGETGKERFFRYRVNFLCVWIEMLANIFLYFSAAYAIIKIAWELVINRIFAGTLAALDLSGGEKIKKLLNNILGLYLALMFTAFTLVLYNDACGFIIDNVSNGNEVIQAVLIALLASVALDGPNVIAKYFGVETGMRGGASFLKSGIRNGVMLHRMGKMNRNMHKQRADSAVRSGGAFGKVAHPFAAAKQSAAGKVNQGVDNLKNKLFGGNDKTPKSSFGNLNKPEDYYDRINKMAKDNGLNIKDKDRDKIANSMYASDHKDDILNNAFKNNLKGENEQKALQSAIKEQGIDKTNGVEAALAGELHNHKEEAYKEISSNAKDNLNKSSKNSGAEPYNNAAEKYLNDRDIAHNTSDVNRLGSRAYGELNKDKLQDNVHRALGGRNLANETHDRGRIKFYKDENGQLKYKKEFSKGDRVYSNKEIKKINKKIMSHQIKQKTQGKQWNSLNAKEAANRALEQ